MNPLNSSGFNLLIRLAFIALFLPGSLLPVSAKQLQSADGYKVYRSVTTTYSNRNYYEKGLVVKIVLKDGSGNLYTESTNDYSLRDIYTGLIITEVLISKTIAPVPSHSLAPDKVGFMKAVLLHKKAQVQILPMMSMAMLPAKMI